MPRAARGCICHKQTVQYSTVQYSESLKALQPREAGGELSVTLLWADSAAAGTHAADR
jgi:hypothetical protein